MRGLTFLARLLSAFSLAILPALPSPADADGLRADKTEIAVGESTTVRLEGVSGLFKTRWKASPEDVLRLDNPSNTAVTVTGLKAGRGGVSAKVLADSYRLDLNVSGDDPNDARYARILGLAKSMGFPDARARIVRMLAEVKDGSRSPQQFYADLGKLPANMFDVIEVRSKLVDGDPTFARDILGPTLGQGSTPVEMKLLLWRREQTLAAIDEVVKRFVESGRVPAEGYALIISHVGKWASQDADALTFTGDIDFSFVCNDVELATAMKNLFAEIIRQRTGLDPKSLDAVATAHGKAGLEVYIGKHGMAFAEEQMKTNEEVDMRTGARRKLELSDVAATLTKERDIADTQGKEAPKPAVDTEPGLSMEMVRHFGHDIVAPKIFDMANAVIKAAKYLDRSYESLKKSGGTPADAEMAAFAKDITAWANTKPQTPELREMMIRRISEFLGTEPRAVFDAETRKLVLALNPGQIAAFHEKATQAMWKTVEQGSTTRTLEMETRLQDLAARKSRGDNVAAEVEKLRADMVALVDMVEAEIKALQGGEVPKVVTDNNAKVRALLNILAGRFGTKALTEEELKDKKFVEELLKGEDQKHSGSRQELTAAYVLQRSLDALIDSPHMAARGAMAGVEKTNQLCDFLDEGALGRLRGSQDFDGMVTEMRWIREAALDPNSKPGALKRLNALKARVALKVKSANETLNKTLQATSAGRQGVKLMMVYGLVDEFASYRNAYNQEGWGAVATEMVRRRVPFGTAVEGVVMGNHLRAGWDFVTTLVPPLALPEAAWGLGTTIGTQVKSTYWSEQLALFVDTLYDGAKFQLESMEQHDKAKVGVYRLVSVKHRGIDIDLSQFASMRQEQVEALRQQIGKGHLDWAKYNQEFQGLTRWTEVDTVLQKNIADSDPMLMLLEEMANHPNVGPKLMDRLAEKGLVRWEEVKLGFITNLIKRLEERKQSEQALGAGMLPELFAELRQAAADLEIEEAMLKALDAEVDTNNLKALMNWFWEAKRTVLKQAPTESETSRAAQVVKKYLDSYKSIRASRDKLASTLPPVTYKDGADRYLTGAVFLSGRAEADKAAAQTWVAHVGASMDASREALLAIKKTFLAGATLDAEDDPFLARVFPRELWMKPLRMAGVASNKLWLVDRAIDVGKARNAVLDEYKAWLEKLAPVQLTVTLVDAGDKLKVISGASGELRPTDEMGKAGSGKASGKQLVFAVPTGRYRLTIKAAGYTEASQDVLLGRALEATPKLTVALTPAGGGDLAKLIADAVKAGDWKRLADRLDAEKKSDLKMADVRAWQANIDALTQALATLKEARMAWVLAARDYLDALDNIDSSVWEKLMRQVETRRAAVEERCWSSSTDSGNARTERCKKEGQAFETACLGTWYDQHWAEQKRIGTAKLEVPDAAHTLTSAGYFSQRAWFEAMEKFADKYQLPHPYPKPVVPRLKYALGCADADLPTAKPGTGIQVAVSASAPSIPLGQSVTLSASASGGKPPYRYAWSSGGNGAQTSVKPRAAGEQTFSVNVSDATGATGSGNARVRVVASLVKLQGVQSSVFYGSSATLSVPGNKPQPVADPCVGKPRSNNPFDQCTVVLVDPSKTVSVSPMWDGGGEPAIPTPAEPAKPVVPPAGSGKQQVVWQSEPAIAFNPSTSSDGRTRVTYTRMGNIKLWCEIQEESEGSYQTVGECEQTTVEVKAPAFAITFTPAAGARIGQEIRAVVNSQPGVADDLIDFRWFEPPSSNRMEYAQNAREIGFKLPDDKPVALKVLARVPYHGDEIATVAADYSGQAWQVKAWAETVGPRPMTWDAKKGGLVPVPQGAYAIHERIPLRAEIVGGTPEGVRWNWTVNDDVTLSNPISQTPTVTRSAPGSINAHVEARDADGALLGSADLSLTVIEPRDAPPPPVGNPSVSLSADPASVERGQVATLNAQVSGGKAPYRYAWQGATGQGPKATARLTQAGQFTVKLTVTDAKGKTGSASLDLDVLPNQADRDKDEATRLAADARNKLQQGDLPGAIDAARQASKLNAKAAAPAATEVATAARKAGWDAVNRRDFNEAVPKLEAAHELAPEDKDIANRLDKARRFAQVWPQVEAKAREFDDLLAQRKIWSAREAMLQMQELQHEMPSAMGNPPSQRVMQAFDAALVEYNRVMQDLEARHLRNFNEKNWQAMLDDALAVKAEREHNLANLKPLDAKIDFARQMLREQAAVSVRPLDLGSVGGKSGTPRTVKGVSIDDGSWLRFKSSDEKRQTLSIPVLTPSRAVAVAIVSNLDDATYLAQGKTIARITVQKDSGDETLDIQAGIHSSEWNYGVGPKHARFDAGDIGDNRFLAVLPLKRPGVVSGLMIDYVETGADKWFGHAPGFCLRGISLVADSKGIALTPPTTAPGNPAATGPANVAGKWKTSEGEATLNQSAGKVTGSYPTDRGEIVGTLNGKVLEGWWIEDNADVRCATPRNGRHYWGRIRWTFDGDKFTGTWSYCDKPADSGGKWSGERIGAAAAAGTINLARGKPASQSSRSQWSRPDDPQGAVDGVINGSFAFHSNNEAKPWWQVDLGAVTRLSEARIYNRMDCCGERARTLQVMLSDDGRTWRTAYRHDGSVFGGKGSKPLVVPLAGQQARYLRLQLNESNWFHLDEVEVMGEPL